MGYFANAVKRLFPKARFGGSDGENWDARTISFHVPYEYATSGADPEEESTLVWEINPELLREIENIFGSAKLRIKLSSDNSSMHVTLLEVKFPDRPS